MGFFEFVAVSLERHSERQFDWWLCVSLLIFCKDFLFFESVAIIH